MERWNLTHPEEEPRVSYIEELLSINHVPTVAVSDYVKLVSDQIRPYVPGSYYCLGTDGFGRSDTRERLRRFFEVDRYYVVLTAIKALVRAGELEEGMVDAALKKYGLDPEKPNPVMV